MKKVYLIHGWGGSNSSEGWFGWLKRELEAKDIELVIFPMPNTNNPKIEEWVGYMEEHVKDVDEETYFIGHSIGCQAILRYLEKLPEGKKVGGIIFIAGWFDLLEDCYESEEEKEIAQPWINTPINLEKVKEHTNKILAIFSDNDDCVPLSDEKLFKEKLNATTIVKNNEGHFNETQSIPEILSFIS